MDFQVNKGQDVILLWSGIQPPKEIEELVRQLNAIVGKDGKISVEHEERLAMSSHRDSSFDVALSGVLFPSVLVHSMELLSEIARILKPKGKLIVREPSGLQGNLRPASKIVSTLKLSGFVEIYESKEVCLTDEEKLELRQLIGNKVSVTILEFTAHKPTFEVGAKTQLSLSFTNKQETKPKVDESVTKIWSLSAQDMGDDDMDLLDSDTLLDEEDLKKPDPASLKSDCGTGKGGKKKACKNCSCGLADELSQGGGTAAKTTSATSSCGSCYLGDAFRCASCPYLGMPAFKPGEKIALTTRQLKGDI